MSPLINMYSASITPKQKKNLLAMYEDYLYFSRGIEMAAQRSSVQGMAAWQLMQMAGSKQIEKRVPWKVEYASIYERQNYENFVNQNFEHKSHYAYISLNHTDLQKDVKLPKIFYIPDDYDVSNVDMELPSPVERYAAAFPKGITLGETSFLIDGKFKASYALEEKAGMPVSEAFVDSKIQTEFRMLMNLVKFYDEQPDLKDKDYFRNFVNIIASEAVAVYENMLLETLNSLADKSHEICQSIYGGRSHDDYLMQAEKDGFIPSAARLQDFLNIRHLMRHQLDTLNSLGKFRPDLAEKNENLRRKYLQSYCDLCDKPVIGRIKAYVAAGDFFRPALKALYPNYIWRENSESNSHFISRIKAFRQKNPDEPLLVEINVPLLSDKRKPLLNSIAKVTDNVRVIDHLQLTDEKFNAFEDDYRKRGCFLRAYNTMECQMMTLCLANGQDCSNKKAWEFMLRRKLISVSDYEKKWKPWRQIRNELSHNHLDASLRQRLSEAFDDFMQATDEMEKKIDAVMPQWERVGENVYQTIHKNGGRGVKIDFNSHRIDKGYRRENIDKAQSSADNAAKPNRKKVYTEVYAGGVEIATAGTEIVACRLPNRMEIKLRKQRIVYPDGSAFYMNAANFNIFQTDKAKVFTGKDFKISKFMDNNQKQKLYRNDTRIIGTQHKITTDQYGRLQKINYKNDNAEAVTLNIVALRGENGGCINFSDGTKLEIDTEGKFKVFHAGIELTFANRQKFAQSYGGGGIIPPSNGGYGR